MSRADGTDNNARFPSFRNATQRTAASVPQPLVERKRSSDWSSSPPALRKKIEVVSTCLRSATKSRKRRCGVCGCVKVRKAFLLPKKLLRCVTLRRVTDCWKTRISRSLYRPTPWVVRPYPLCIIVPTSSFDRVRHRMSPETRPTKYNDNGQRSYQTDISTGNS